MKKLFISCPMRGRTKEKIRESMDYMHRAAEIIYRTKLDVIPTFINDAPPKDVQEKIWFLGKSIEKLSEADYFVFLETDAFIGCNIEKFVALGYDIESCLVTKEEIKNTECFSDIADII